MAAVLTDLEISREIMQGKLSFVRILDQLLFFVTNLAYARLRSSERSRN